VTCYKWFSVTNTIFNSHDAVQNSNLRALPDLGFHSGDIVTESILVRLEWSHATSFFISYESRMLTVNFAAESMLKYENGIIFLTLESCYL
jgi:hypothetical protein